jgi:hypothetical protein
MDTMQARPGGMVRMSARTGLGVRELDAETRGKLLVFHDGRSAHMRGFGLELNPHERHTVERALWESGWLTQDREVRRVRA